jgi:Zn finger protein HypA/HybF involved in hydrogenase expression
MMSEPVRTAAGFECGKCKYRWAPKPADHVPAYCPRCRTPFHLAVRKPRPEIRCPSCKYRWRPRIDRRPKKCPRCYVRLEEKSEAQA